MVDICLDIWVDNIQKYLKKDALKSAISNLVQKKNPREDESRNNG